ncbi:MAG: hypothetical protein KKB50_21550 [Planctomycetes bacterium]|nr:hypothetical protein [Planctomycetota bacterium]
MVLHGDCNCDGLFNAFDIEDFIARIQEDPPCCWEECGPCWDRGSGGGNDPEATADLLLTYVHPKHMPIVITAIDDLIKYYGDNDAGRYWAAVRAALLE